MSQSQLVSSFDLFTKHFREEHRIIRDSLLLLTQAFNDHDKGEVQRHLDRIIVLTGPHFRYEEDALYPALVGILGNEYIQKLLHDHDVAIGMAKKLVELAGNDAITGEDVVVGVKLTRGALPYVSECEGVSIMVERLPGGKVESILLAREHSRKENLNLLEWASKVRNRAAISVEG